MTEIFWHHIHGEPAKANKSAARLCSDIFLNINKLSCHLWLEAETDFQAE